MPMTIQAWCQNLNTVFARQPNRSLTKKNSAPSSMMKANPARWSANS